MGMKEELEEAKKKLESIENKRRKQYKNQNDYVKDNYDRMSLNLPKGEKGNIIAKYGNISLNAYICHLVDADLRGTEELTTELHDTSKQEKNLPDWMK